LLGEVVGRMVGAEVAFEAEHNPHVLAQTRWISALAQ
jgi:hypothetical protein